MIKKTIAKVVLILLGTVGTCWAGCCAKSSELQCQEKVNAEPVEAILKQLTWKTRELKSYQCRIEYLFSQPVLDSETLRKGVLYYANSDGKSKLHITFQTLRHDDEK